MKTIALKAQTRTELGKTQVKKLRSEGLTPAVIYTPEGAVHIKLPTTEANKVLFTPDSYLVQLDVDGKNYNTVVSDAGFHPVHDNVLDVEFNVVHDNRAVQVQLPVQLTGSSVGVIAGGRLVQKARRLKVRGLYNKLPDLISLDITNLRLGHSLKVRDLKFDHFVVAENGDVPIASVELTRTLRQEAATGGKK